MRREYYEFMLNAVKNGTGDSDKHLLTLYSIAMQMSAKSVLELGVRDGTTTLPFLCAMAENNGCLYSVDIAQTCFVCPIDLREQWRFYKSDALEWLDQARNEKPHYGEILPNKFDLVYVDDWHSYDHVRAELELIEPMITPSSIIILHDLMYSNAQPDYRSNVYTQDQEWKNGGPYRAVSELDSTIWEYSTIPVNHGLTILRKKSGRIVT
jgi:predicted O-methyltransferase YrrM